MEENEDIIKQVGLDMKQDDLSLNRLEVAVISAITNDMLIDKPDFHHQQEIFEYLIQKYHLF